MEFEEFLDGRQRRQGISQRDGKYGWWYSGPDALQFRWLYDRLYPYLYRELYWFVAKVVFEERGLKPRVVPRLPKPFDDYDGPDRQEVAEIGDTAIRDLFLDF